MKIVALQAENVKKLVAVEIRPDGNLVEITGKNGQGKTSVLDSIWWALAGASNIQRAPIRNGQDHARIRLDLGEIIVTRVFNRVSGGEKTTSSITVENVEGARFPSPQAMLDDLLDNLSFDPLAFSRMDPKKQFDTLRQFVPGVDFESIDRLNERDYAQRTDLNRRAKESRTQEAMIEVPLALPSSPIDEAALVDKLEAAAKHNADIETRKAKRIEFKAEINRKEDALNSLKEQAAELSRRAEELVKQAALQYQEVLTMEKKLDDAPALPEPVDVSTLRMGITTAKEVNAAFHLRSQKIAHRETAEKLEAQASALTEAMQNRNAAKLKAISAAKLPVPGIGFGDGNILMNEVPFDQASDAEQLRASIAIAMALNPKLKVVRVRDGSLLDDESMKLLAEMADEKDYQIWIERVDGSGKVGFVLENGHVKSPVRQVAA